MDRPRTRVEFNELVEADLVLLSSSEGVLDSDGNDDARCIWDHC